MRESIKITFIGDVLCDAEMSQRLERYYDVRTGGYRFEAVFAPMREHLAESDYVFANLETPLSGRTDNLTNKQYEFCTHISFAEALKGIGVQCVSTANNHCLDRGYEGLLDTIHCLEKLGLKHNGIHDVTAKREPVILDIKGCKAGFLSYTYGTNAFSNNQYLPFRERKAVDLLQAQEEDRPIIRSLYAYMGKHKETAFAKLYFKAREKMIHKPVYERRNVDFYRKLLLRRDIRALKAKGVDKLFFYLHIGGQYNQEPTSYTKRMVAYLMKKGCDIVIANHEHVIHGCVQDVERAKLGTYALGNFLGSAGTLHPPYDRCCDFSILLHAYLDAESKEIKRFTYSVTKTLFQEKTEKFEVHPVFELVKTLEERESREMTDRALQAAFLFSGKKETVLLEEFDLVL